MQCQCGKEVKDGRNGTIYDAPPWNPKEGSFALCWECENRLEAKHEHAQQARLERAAERYHEKF